jgi:ABC-type amino acid transport substrate-binding protein
MGPVTNCKVMLCVVLLVASGCNSSNQADMNEPSRDHESRSNQIVRIGSDALFPPFHFVQGEDLETAVRDSSEGIDFEKVSGYDIELLRAVLDHAGLEHQTMVVRPYDALFKGIAKGHHDVVAATTGITKQRQELYLFSDPYYETCQAIVVRIGDDEPKTISDLQGRKVGAAGAGTSAKAAGELPNVETVILEKGSLGLTALYEGEIDAYVVDEFEAVAMARADSGKLAVLAEPAAPESYGFVMGKDQTELQSRINESLNALKANGRIKKLREQFGVARDDQWPVKIGE